jgi:hypothetical protein
MNTCTCCGTKVHISQDCFTRMREGGIEWRKFPHPKPGEKPLNRKERLRLARLENKNEVEAINIRWAYKPTIPKFHPPDIIILQPELHIKPCPICEQIGHRTMDCPELYTLCLKTRDRNHISAGT